MVRAAVYVAPSHNAGFPIEGAPIGADPSEGGGSREQPQALNQTRPVACACLSTTVVVRGPGGGTAEQLPKGEFKTARPGSAYKPTRHHRSCQECSYLSLFTCILFAFCLTTAKTRVRREHIYTDPRRGPIDPLTCALARGQWSPSSTAAA